mgnify:CR=1
MRVLPVMWLHALGAVLIVQPYQELYLLHSAALHTFWLKRGFGRSSFAKNCNCVTVRVPKLATADDSLPPRSAPTPEPSTPRLPADAARTQSPSKGASDVESDNEYYY